MQKSKELASLTTSLNLVPVPMLWGKFPEKISFCNKAFVDLTGISKKEITRGLWLDAINRLDRKRLQAALELACADKTDNQLNIRIKTGSRKSKYFTAYINNSDKKNLIFILFIQQEAGIVKSIIKESTEEIAAKSTFNVSTEALKKELNRSVVGKGSYDLAQIVELSQDAIISYTTKGVIESWNRGASQLYGFSSEEAVGKNLSIIVPPEREDEIANLLNALQQNRIIDAYETTRQRKDGNYVLVSLMVSPIIDSRGKVVAGFSVARDITRLQEAEEALLNQAHQLAKSNAELEQFAWMAAHDLKEPIRTMTTYAHLIADEISPPPDSDMARMLKFLTDSGLRASERIRDVLTYSSLGKKEFVIQLTDMNRLVEKVIADLKQTISERNAVINVGNLPAVMCNEQTVMLLFQNLIANSIKFNDSAPVIEIRASKKKGIYLFEVEDNGIGFSDSSKEKIFNMFARLNPSKYPGTGIGLAICKKVVELHRGKIWVDSKEGKGTTFFFSIDNEPE